MKSCLIMLTRFFSESREKMHPIREMDLESYFVKVPNPFFVVCCVRVSLIGTQINLRVCEQLSLERKSVCVSVRLAHWNANPFACQ